MQRQVDAALRGEPWQEVDPFDALFADPEPPRLRLVGAEEPSLFEELG